MTRHMVFTRLGEIQFGVRVAGLLLDGERVLLQGTTSDDIWVLPGGRLEALEPTDLALKRELLEELGVEVHIERLLWVVENFFQHEGVACHEIGFYYLVELPPGSDLLSKGDSFGGVEYVADRTFDLVFRWFLMAELGSLVVYPLFLRQPLLPLPTQLERVVIVED